MVVEQELQKLDIPFKQINLGEVILEQALNKNQEKKIKIKLVELGFEAIDNQKSLWIEQIKTTIISWVHHGEMDIKTNLSEYISKTLQQDYNQLSHFFSEVEGITIEKYYIAQKIERVKELLVYDELSVKEIADLLNYSSAAYLSNQFKKITGLSPGHFKKIKTMKRTPLDKI
jgi:YesN/AraC family two-component response regulator